MKPLKFQFKYSVPVPIDKILVGNCLIGILTRIIDVRVRRPIRFQLLGITRHS
jgi:hypothetical protein